MGIEPTYPDEKYGYIRSSPVSGGGFTFTEKPDRRKAKEYIRQDALWNSGIFAYKLSYVLDKSRELLETSDYHELTKNYGELKKISFDYAMAETETSIGVLRCSGYRKDPST